MVVSGGTVPGAAVSDTWELSLPGTPAWAGIASQRPIEAGQSSIAIYDTIEDRMIVFGGMDDSTVPHNETWALSQSGLPTWSQLSPSGNPPPARYEHAAVYDPVRDRIIVLGGLDSNGNDLQDTWASTTRRPAKPRIMSSTSGQPDRAQSRGR